MARAKQTELQLAQLSDAKRIAVMSRDLIEAGFPWRWQAERIMQKIRDPNTNVLVARTPATIIGFGIMHYRMEDAHLLLLAVNPAYRRQGTGRDMVLWLEKCARVAGIRQIRLEVRERNRAARKFYQSLGYKETQTLPRYYNGREAAVSMTHELIVPV